MRAVWAKQANVFILHGMPADLVTEMKLVKHPYRSGIKAQKGVEF